MCGSVDTADRYSMPPNLSTDSRESQPGIPGSPTNVWLTNYQEFDLTPITVPPPAQQQKQQQHQRSSVASVTPRQRHQQQTAHLLFTRQTAVHQHTNTYTHTNHCFSTLDRCWLTVHPQTPCPRPRHPSPPPDPPPRTALTSSVLQQGVDMPPADCA